MHGPQVLKVSRVSLLIMVVASSSCVTTAPQPISLRLIPRVDAPVGDFRLRVVDSRLSRLFVSNRAETVIGGDVLQLVRNRVEDELARHDIAVRDTGPELLVEILDFGWGWRRVSLVGLQSEAAGAFRMQVTAGEKTMRFTGERDTSGPGADSLPMLADQLELALDDAMKSLGESPFMNP
jgi:hypothetical protein